MQPAQPYTLRQASNADRDAVWALISGVLQRYGIQTNRQTTDKDLTDLELNFTKPHGAFFVLKHVDEIVGTVALRSYPHQRVELCRMYLLETHRGKGLGRMMLEHALAEARKMGMKTVFLKTASVLGEAIALYRKAGFEAVPGATTCGNCDMRMEKTLMSEEPRRSRPGQPGS